MPSFHNLPPAGARRSLRWQPLALAAALAMMGTASAQAQSPTQPGAGQSMEERLRAQLRVTTSQLQQAQNELAALKAGMPAAGAAPAAAPAQVDSLKKDLDQSRAQLDAERAARQKLDDNNQQLRQQAQEVVEKANAQVAQYHNAYDELLKMARASEAERQRLAGDTGMQRTALQQCEAKNTQMYSVGQEILHAYETLDVSTVLASRQPFAAKERVKLDEVAQQYGDKLYEGRFDERSVTAAPQVPVSAPAAPAAPAPAAKP